MSDEVKKARRGRPKMIKVTEMEARLAAEGETARLRAEDLTGRLVQAQADLLSKSLRLAQAESLIARTPAVLLSAKSALDEASALLDAKDDEIREVGRVLSAVECVIDATDCLKADDASRAVLTAIRKLAETAQERAEKAFKVGHEGSDEEEGDEAIDVASFPSAIADMFSGLFDG